MLYYPGSLLSCDIRFLGTCIKAMFTTMWHVGVAIELGIGLAKLIGDK